MGKLRDYNKEHNLRMEDLASICGSTVSHLNYIDKNPFYNVTAKTMDMIYIGTKSRFGEGLTPDKYLDHSCFKGKLINYKS